MGYIDIFGCLFFTVYGQLVLKWRLVIMGSMPKDLVGKFFFLGRALLDPFVISGFLAAFVASLFWMSAMTKFEISFAYPFMSLSFIAVLIFGSLLFNEPITIGKIFGMILICSGIIASVKL